MKKALLIPILILAACAPKMQDLTSKVDPMIGSGGHGHVFVGASVPFGMVQLGPTQITQGWDWCSGYHISDTMIIGFSHTHLSGTGIGDLGDLMMLPFDPAKTLRVEAPYEPNMGLAPTHIYAHLDHELEKVAPGYYEVELPDYGVKARLTAGDRTGYHEYTFSSDQSAILVDLFTGVGWDSVTDYNMEVVDDHTIQGYRNSTGWAKDQKFYFYARFSQPFTIGEPEKVGVGATHGDASVLVFDTSKDKTVYVEVGISPHSIQHAEVNLDYETDNNFETSLAQAKDAWNKVLNTIQIEPLDEAQEEIFYTALYHANLMPALFSDAGEEDRYTIFSLWDAYRAAFPLMTVIQRDRSKDFAKSFMEIYGKQGKLPVWHLWGNETDCMIGNPGVIIMGDYVIKGIYPDADKALEAMVTSSMLDERGMAKLKEYGYIPWDNPEDVETVSQVLEIAVADAAVAKVADITGDIEQRDYFAQRSKAYQKHFDPETGFIRAKGADGTFRTPFNPYQAEHQKDDYTEGNGWQYTFMVPQDVEGLIECFGGNEAFIKKLDGLFAAKGPVVGNANDVTGLIGQYAHGNEPCHHVAYMYDVAGQPEKCQKIVRTVMDSLYFDGPYGLCGNEDVGQMSSWYVLSALGLYQLDPSGGDFYLGSPAVKKAVINGNFTIIAKNNSKENIYVKSVKLNGKTLSEPKISYSDIMKGGKLEFEMTNKPNNE